MSKTITDKTEYLQQLQKYLKKLPASDYEDAMEYFTEYFEDADDEGTATLIRELGTPKEAARDLMANLLDKKLTEKDSISSDANTPLSGKHSWKSILWISFLLLCTVPIGVPLLISAVIILLCIMLCAVILDLCVFILAFCGYIIGIKLILRGLLALPISISGAAMIAGSGICIIGLSVLCTILAIYLSRWECQFFVASVKWIFNRRKKGE